MRSAIARPVLVVEDSDEDFDTAVEALLRAQLPNPVRRALSGDQCLRLLRDDAGTRALAPAFVLLDLNTPGTDGRVALAEIRADVTLRTVPVVVLSTSNNPRDVEACYRAGANAYHVKPLRYAEHLDLVEGLMIYWLTSVQLPHGPGSS